MTRVLAFVYGVACYAVFLGTFLYAIGFVGGFAVPKTIDSGAAGPVGTAVLVNLGLLALFGLQHSVMARQGFKERWTRIVPRPVERSTYVLFTSLVLIALFALWRPLPEMVWEVEATAGRAVLWGLYGAGWLVVLLATFMIDHFDLFGLRQVWTHLKGERYQPPEFQTPGIYRYVRHPLMTGFLLAFWATPEMSAGHLLFAGVSTLYVLVALRFEERDLIEFHGEKYREYRRRTPMLIPWPGGGEQTGAGEAGPMEGGAAGGA
ncbi:MAG: methanethiol S-methyltransferase [Gemmatimonadota bacterium]